MQRAGGDRRHVAGCDELGEEVMCLLAVREAGKRLHYRQCSVGLWSSYFRFSVMPRLGRSRVSTVMNAVGDVAKSDQHWQARRDNPAHLYRVAPFVAPATNFSAARRAPVPILRPRRSAAVARRSVDEPTMGSGPPDAILLTKMSTCL